MLLRDSALLEEFLHQLVIAFRHQLDELFVSFLRRILKIGWNLAFFPFAIPAQLVGAGFHSHQIDDARKVLLAPNRQLQRYYISPECTG